MPGTFRFGPAHRYVLDLAARTLHAGGQAVPLGARAFDVLAALAQAGGELVTKDRLLQQGWPGLVVEEANLHVQVSTLRKLLGAEAIATVPSVGYRFAWTVKAGSDAAAAHNLPAARTGFVGREALLDEARRRLGSTRLLTLIGIGGAGKTRLALKLAEQLLPAFADGVGWVDLAPLDRSEQLPSAIAQALGVPPQGRRDLTDTLVDALRERQLLVVLDNCEHLIDASVEVAEALLAGVPGLKLIVTSREALALDGEVVLPVRPLALPAASAPTEALIASEAVRLFAERAAMAAPWFTLASGEAQVVADICRRVDGIPLAIELAAAQLRVVSPTQLLELLQQRFRLLAGQRRALPRQQTMHAVIQWSYEHLRPDEQQLLMALAICGGGCELDAAAALMGPETSRVELLAALSRLAEQSLLTVQHGAEHARYHLLETVRQFALERLQDNPRAALLRSRHVEHFVALAEAQDAEIARHGRGAASLAQLDLERENLLRAFEACERDDSAEALTLALRLAAALRYYWTSRAIAPLGLKLTLAVLERSAGRTCDRHQMLAMISATQLLWWLGRLDEALALARQFEAGAATLGDRVFAANAQRMLGTALDMLGRCDEAATHHEASRRLAEELGDQKLVADALSSLARLASLRERFDEAMALCEQGLAIRRASGHGWHVAVALLNCGFVATQLGRLGPARAWLLEAARLLPSVGSMHLEIEFVEFTICLAAATRDAAAVARLRAALALQRASASLPQDAEAEASGRQQLDEARAQLGPAAFERASAEGAALDHAGMVSSASAWLQALEPTLAEAGAAG